jgi:hypothetical protein
MMVHSSDAPAADATVVRPRRSINLATRANGPVNVVTARFRGMHIRKIQFTGGERQSSWIGDDGSHVRHAKKENYGIEHDHVERAPQTGTEQRSGYRRSAQFVDFTL